MLAATFARHDRIALSFSGGKDSLACVYLLRGAGLLERVTLYHSDPGDLLPEVVGVVEHVRAMVPRFVHVRTDAAAWMERNGLPSDLVPWTQHPLAEAVGYRRGRLVSRFDCCIANLMLPVWERIKADGNTLCIRGARRADLPRMATASGDVAEGIEILHPIEDWSAEQVFAYLREQGAPICRVYDGGRLQSPECATCPAWWSEGRAAYLAQHHPELLRRYRARMALVMDALGEPMQALRRELAGLSN